MGNQSVLYEYESLSRKPNLLKKWSKLIFYSTILLFMGLSAFNTYTLTRNDKPVKSSRILDATLLENSDLQRKINHLEGVQTDLTRQLNALTQQNGVLERIIQHVNDLRKQDEFILDELVTVQSAQGPLALQAANGGVGVQHQIVTHPVSATPSSDSDRKE